MKKTFGFTDSNTSLVFDFLGMSLLALLVVIPLALFVAGLAIKGVFNILNILPVISGICSFFFFKTLNQDILVQHVKNQLKTLIRLLLLLLIFIFTVTIFLIYSV